MCGSVSLKHITSGGLSPSGNVAILSSRELGVVLAPSSSREKMPGKRGALSSGTVAATPAMVSQV